MQSQDKTTGRLLPPTRGRWRWQLLGMALGALFALWIVPATGWLLRDQFRLRLPLPFATETAQSGQSRLSAVATNAKDQIAVQVANAISMGRIAYSEENPPNDYAKLAVSEETLFGLNEATTVELEKVLRHYPNQPMAYAVYLRYFPANKVSMVREEVGTIAPYQNGGEIRRTNTPGGLALFERAAREGERLDPENAFFPTMQAAACFAAHQDKEALEALARAAEKSRWKDYSFEEVQGSWRLEEAAFGKQSSLMRSQQVFRPIGSYYNDLTQLSRDYLTQLAQMVQWQTAQQEKRRHIEAGIALRGRLIRLGALIRDQAHDMTDRNLGLELMTRGMAPPRNALLSSQSSAIQNGLTLDARPLSQDYGVYLRETGHQDEAEWLQRQKDINAQLPPTSSDIAPMNRPILYLAGIFLLNEIALFALVGGVCGLLVYLGRFAFGSPRPLSRPVAWGLFAGIVGSVGFAGGIEYGREGFTIGSFPAPMFLVMIVMGIGLLGVCFRRQRPFFFATGITLFCGVGLFALTLWSVMGTWLSSDFVRSPSLCVVLLVFPLLTAFGLMIGSARKRVPVSFGVVQGFHRLTIPLLALLILGYVGYVFPTVRRDAEANVALVKMLDNDLAYTREPPQAR